MDTQLNNKLKAEKQKELDMVQSVEEKAPYFDTLPKVTREKITKYFWKLKATHPNMSMDRLWKKTGEKFKIKFEIE